MNLSFQLYSARNFTPWPEFLRKLSQQGYAEVEGYGDVFADPAGFAQSLREAGLTMPSGHFSIDMLENELEKAVDIMQVLGIRQVYCPYLNEEDRPKDAAGWQAFAQRLATIGDKLRAKGIGFGWHNHDFEFKALPDGQMPMSIILDHAPSIEWEADIAWVAVGGEDPYAWIEKYGDRIFAIHIKDRAPEGQNADQDGWCDVGDGTMGWDTLLAAVKAKTSAKYFVVEHDNPADGVAFAANSISYLKSI